MSEPHRLDPRWCTSPIPPPTASASPPPARGPGGGMAQAGIDIRTLRTQAQVLAALAVLSDRAVEQLASFCGQTRCWTRSSPAVRRP